MRSFLFVILFLTSAIGTTQEQLSTSLSRDTIFVGQPSSYMVILTSDQLSDSSNVEWHIPSDSLSSGLEILSIKTTNESKNNKLILKASVRFSAEKTGYYPISPISLTINNRKLDSEAKLVTVYSTISNPETEEIRHMKESININYSLFDAMLDNWLWILMGVLVITLSFIGIRSISPKENIEVAPLEPKEPVIPPYDLAIQKFDKLEARQLWQTGELKQYHSEISYILREFLEGQLSISALENTSGEIIQALAKFNFGSSLIGQLKTLLTLTDLVKFAKQQPSEKENRQLIIDAMKVVNEIHSLTKIEL